MVYMGDQERFHQYVFLVKNVVYGFASGVFVVHSNIKLLR